MRIDLSMTLGIMFLDMFKLRRLGSERGDVPIQMPQPAMQCGEPAADVTEVAFEVLYVDGVETDYRGE